MAKLIRTRTEHVLNFSGLSPRDFERMCLWLLRKEGFADVEHIGAAGSDEGCDISATKDGCHWICQCKRVGRFGPKAVEMEIDKICQCLKSERPSDILFITACDISAETRARARMKARATRCHFWAATDLDARVKEHKEILAEFFEAPGTERDPYFVQFGFAVLDYLHVVDNLVEQNRIEQLFVPLAGEVDSNGQSAPVEVWEFINDWLSGAEHSRLAVLGDYGTGKSWLCLRLAKKLGEAFRAAPASQPVPLLLTFRSYSTGMSLDNLISTAIIRDYGLKDCNIHALLEAIRNHKIVLILDGLDEMARELGRRDALLEFTRLGVPSAARAVVTCRAHYFLSGTEQREVLSPDAMGLPMGTACNFTILHLKLLNETRMQEAIRRRVEKNQESRMLNFVRSTYNLPELCARPVLLELVCRSYGALVTIEHDITSADLYESYLRTWLGREFESGRLGFTRDDVLNFLERLAEILFRRGSLWLSGVEFKEVVDAYGDGIALSEAEKRSLVRQLATSTFLSRTRDDGWEFVHRSIQEFLYAKRFFRWESETNGIGIFPVTHVPARQFVAQLVLREWTEQKARKWIVERVRRDQEPSLCKTTLRAAAAYWLLHGSRRGASDYSLRGIMLDSVDLRRVNLAGVDLTSSDLHNSDLRGVNLRRAVLRDCLLTSTDFSGADLTGADLRGSDCRGASFDGADTRDVQWKL